jgi:hypothetical protein
VHSYPLNVGGRPAHAVPAFLLATFEGTILGASLMAFFGCLVALRLPTLWAPEDEIDGFSRASIDHCWIVVGHCQSQEQRERAGRLLANAGAQREILVERP